MKKITLEWFKAALIRALRTIAQTALGMFTIGMAFSEVDWVHVLSVSAAAGIYSLLTSLATTLPEVGTDGELKVDTSDPEKDTYLLSLNDSIDKLSTKKRVAFKVKYTDTPSQE